MYYIKLYYCILNYITVYYTVFLYCIVKWEVNRQCACAELTVQRTLQQPADFNLTAAICVFLFFLANYSQPCLYLFCQGQMSLERIHTNMEVVAERFDSSFLSA